MKRVREPSSCHEIRKHKVTVLAHLTEQLLSLYIHTVANKLMYRLHFEHFKHHNKQVNKKKKYIKIVDPS